MSVLKESQHLKLSFKQIEIATNNFEQCIGKGGYGMVYIGQLLIDGNSTMVAVKRLNEQFGQGLKEFLMEIQLLTGQNHPNLITLLGYCDEGKEKIIVYEYAEHGSLDRYLMRNKTTYVLSWLQRLKICVDAARGLNYLHNHVGKHQTIIHRDIKSSNILLDHNWVAKISDLGLSKLALSGLNRSSVVSNACGTHGYCEPEYFSTGIVKKESDVYSFGMVLSEIICGRVCFIMDDNGFKLSAPLVKDYYEKKKLDEIVDPILIEQMSFESINNFFSIAYQCLHDDRARRPPMNLVMKELEELLKMESPSYALETQSRIRPQAMEIERVASIKLGGVGLPIVVRVLRKWVPRLRQEDTCYLLVDQFGSCIMAVAHKGDRKYVEPKFQTKFCYRIRDYVCVPADLYVNIIKHPVSLRVGDAASIEILADIDRLPQMYFEFCPYEDIEALLGNNQQVIDYIGLVQGKTYRAQKTGGDPYLCVTLMDSSGRSMEATLWKEIITHADRFDRIAIDNATVPSVLAVTSMCVKQIRGRTELSSTAATYTYLNPNVEETKSLTSWFEGQTSNEQACMSQIGKTPSMLAVEVSAIKIQAMLQGGQEDFSGKTFTCTASVTEIITKKGWYYNACPQCPKKMFESGKDWACSTHGRHNTSEKMFCVTVKIADETGIVTATIFNKPMTTLLRTTCSELISRDGFSDRASIPAPIQAIKGKQKRFFVKVKKFGRTGSTSCTVNRVSDPVFQTPKASLATRVMPVPAPVSGSVAVTTTPKRTLFTSSDNPIRESKLARYQTDR